MGVEPARRRRRRRARNHPAAAAADAGEAAPRLGAPPAAAADEDRRLVALAERRHHLARRRRHLERAALRRAPPAAARPRRGLAAAAEGRRRGRRAHRGDGERRDHRLVVAPDADRRGPHPEQRVVLLLLGLLRGGHDRLAEHAVLLEARGHRDRALREGRLPGSTTPRPVRCVSVGGSRTHRFRLIPLPPNRGMSLHESQSPHGMFLGSVDGGTGLAPAPARSRRRPGRPFSSCVDTNESRLRSGSRDV